MDMNIELEELNMQDFNPEFDRGSANVIPYLSAISVAAAYDNSVQYVAGDYVTYGGMLYVCTAESATGEWDEASWQSACIAQMIQDCAADSDHVQEIIDNYGGE